MDGPLALAPSAWTPGWGVTLLRRELGHGMPLRCGEQQARQPEPGCRRAGRILVRAGLQYLLIQISIIVRYLGMTFSRQ